MAAPSGITWGTVVNSGTSKAARLGIYITSSNNANNPDTVRDVSVQVWIWTRYRVSDSSNTVAFNWDSTSASTTVKSNVSVSTTNTEWSTSNQVLLYSATKSYTKTKEAVTYNCAGKISGLDYIGSAVSTSKSFTVSAKTSYTITFDANGGDGAPDAQTKWYGETLTLSSTVPTKPGHVFKGWGTSTTGEVAYAEGDTVPSTRNASVTLYAIWEANTYSITYNANGGSGAPATQTKTYGVDIVLHMTTPTRPDYKFLGWATSSSGAVAYAPGDTYSSDATLKLYAKWELIYIKPRITNLKITRASNGASATVSFSWATDKTVTSVKIEYKAATATSWSAGPSVSYSGTSGTVPNTTVGGSWSADTAYSVRVTVTDSSGNTPETVTLGGNVYPIDYLVGGKGTAIGKAAETENLFEVAWPSKFNGAVQFPGGITGATTFDSSITLPSIELSRSQPFIDFHYGSSTADNTSRIIESASGTLSINGYKFTKSGNAAFPKALPLGSGGTGGTTALAARTNLGLTYTGIACSYTGNGTDDVATSSTAATVPMTAANVNTDNAFSLSGGGIVCPYAGTIAVSAGVYLKTNSACHAGIYIYKNSSETVSDMRYLNGQFAASIGTRIMSVAAGDVIYLKARSMTAGSASSGNRATHLTIAYVR